MEIQKGNGFQNNSTHFLKYYHNTGVLVQGLVNKEPQQHLWIEIHARHTPYYPEMPNQILVIDLANGKTVVLPRDVYYRVANVDRKSMVRFTTEQYTELQVKHKSYGPFEVTNGSE